MFKYGIIKIRGENMQKVLSKKYSDGTMIEVKKVKYTLKYLRPCVTFLGEPQGYLHELIKKEVK